VANTITSPDIPEKQYFRIGEVASLAGVESYVLRFWETEFRGISPKRTESGQRLYRRSDVELIFKIKHLLHEQKFTIRGAKQYLQSARKKKAAVDAGITVEDIRAELMVIRDLIGGKE